MKLFGNNKNKELEPLPKHQNNEHISKPIQSIPTDDNIPHDPKTLIKVIYNGGNVGYYPCDEPTSLVVGQEYTVVEQIDLKFQTNYVLDGVEGEFNSIWFNIGETLTPTYMAIGYKKNPPRVGYCFYGFLLEFTSGGMPVRTALTTSTVMNVNIIGKNMLQVQTRNSIYIVSLIL